MTDYEIISIAREIGWNTEHQMTNQMLIRLCDRVVHTKSASGTEAAVCLDIMGRQEIGIKKYGTTVADNPLSLKQWLQHAYEECLDQAVYLRRAIDELENN